MFGSEPLPHGRERVLALRRAQDEKLAQLSADLDEQFQLKCKAKWVERGRQKAAAAAQARELDSKEPTRGLHSDIHQRREALRKLLADEEAALRVEVSSRIESTEQRRERLKQRAESLKKQRLERKEAFVAEMRAKQFRAQCDELRLNHGRNLVLECARIRRQQIEDQQRRQQYEQESEKRWLGVWRSELDKKNERERREQTEKAARNLEMKLALEKQISEHHSVEEQAKLQKQRETEERVSRELEAARKAEATALERAKEKEARRAAERKRYEDFLRLKNAEREMDLIEEQRCLQQAMDAEAKDQNARSNAKEAYRKDQAEYMDYMGRLEKENQEKEAERERMRQQAEREEWAKKEGRWQRESEAKQRLLQQVLAERADQVALKKATESESQHSGAQQREVLLAEAAAFKAAEEEKTRKKLMHNREIQAFLKKQMKQRREESDQEHLKLAAEQDRKKELEWYQHMLAAEMRKDTDVLDKGLSTHHYPKTSANWWTH